MLSDKIVGGSLKENGERERERHAFSKTHLVLLYTSRPKVRSTLLWHTHTELVVCYD